MRTVEKIVCAVGFAQERPRHRGGDPGRLLHDVTEPPGQLDSDVRVLLGVALAPLAAFDEKRGAACAQNNRRGLSNSAASNSLLEKFKILDATSVNAILYTTCIIHT